MDHRILEMCSFAQEGERAGCLYFYIKINCIVHKFSSFFFFSEEATLLALSLSLLLASLSFSLPYYCPALIIVNFVFYLLFRR